MYGIAFYGAVFATGFWTSAYATAFCKIRNVIVNSTNKKRKNRANELLKSVVVRGIVGTLVLFWAAIEFGLMAQNHERLFGSYILNEAVTSHISGVLMAGMAIAIVVMGITSLHDYLSLEGMRYNGRQRASGSIHK